MHELQPAHIISGNIYHIITPYFGTIYLSVLHDIKDSK